MTVTMAIPPNVTKANAFEILHAYPKGASLFQRVSGAIGASFFSLTYVIAPIWVITAIVAPFVLPFNWYSMLLYVPVVVSALIPPIPSGYMLKSWPFKYMPAYFDFTEISETSDAEIKELLATKRVIFTAQPHGVFTFGGACAGVEWGKRFWDPADCPTTVANVVMKFPLVKHAVGIFGTCDASPRTLKKTLAKRSVVLYPGGISELFLCDEKEERLFVKKRKGFIKVALQSGVDVIPVYLFGNTQVLKVAKSPVLRAMSRAMGVTITWFWGVWGTVVPFEKKIVSAMGRPLGLPHILEPTPEDVEKYHALYVSEVQRIFDAYKGTNPDFAKKDLIFEE
mmetsp:Transcript_26538/g.44427  ORF Transcript_26538/g.44427 Transcript_26538/m.44427 type:complete len:339 (-) Transcript_26538:234-1250(-)|eukprot:CAMPEP_0198199930 /NCGR_PEP_ID=MMETSP1445-20131203/3036_1 /TAXON_ID=36898 /ORGANISM="Pyramimonas sp., Strain CCMP2087" /LENGTH=338 /DNA_ID=CAMNT_0043869841 /DNA_START=143 /DNA_END=1162 /DNA_ORIENTATION=+